MPYFVNIYKINTFKANVGPDLFRTPIIAGIDAGIDKSCCLLGIRTNVMNRDHADCVGMALYIVKSLIH